MPPPKQVRDRSASLHHRAATSAEAVPYDAPVEMRIYGPNIAELRRIGMEIREIMTAIPFCSRWQLRSQEVSEAPLCWRYTLPLLLICW
ncbi:MAG: hypothetical protein AAGI69_30095 [Cyanobacteria bacterium P01_H01_bin.21]